MSKISKPGPTDLFLLVFIAVIWGSAFTAIKLVVGDLGTFWAAAARVIIGFLSVLVCVPFFAKRVSVSQKTFGLIGLVAMLNMVIPFIMISWAMNHVEAGVGALLLGTTPIIAMVMGHFLTQDERINSGRVLAVCLAISGIVVLVGRETLAGLGAVTILAQVAIVSAGACYVSAGFVMRRIDMDPVAFTAIALGIGSAILGALAFAVAGRPNLDLSAEVVYALLWLGAVPTGLAYMLRFWLVRRVGVSTFALAMNTVPVFGILIGALYLGEVIRISTVLALLLVLAGLGVARYATPEQATVKAGDPEK